MLASIKANRDSIGIEIDPAYCKMIINKFKKLNSSLFVKRNIFFKDIISASNEDLDNEKK